MTKKDVEDYLKDLDKNIKLVESENTLSLYYGYKDMGIDIVGMLDRGTEYTLETLKMEVEVFLKERLVAKLIISEDKEKPKKRRKKKSSHKKERF